MKTVQSLIFGIFLILGGQIAFWQAVKGDINLFLWISVIVGCLVFKIVAWKP